MPKSTRSGYSNIRENPPEAVEAVEETPKAEEPEAKPEPTPEPVAEADNDPVEEPRPKTEAKGKKK